MLGTSADPDNSGIAGELAEDHRLVGSNARHGER
jgi:hypothetical protein